MKKKILIIPLTLCLFTSCHNNTSIVSETSSTQSSLETEVSLKKAIDNTKNNYELKIITSTDYESTFSIIADDFYYYAPNGIGYCILDNDSSYYHGFDLTLSEDASSTNDYVLTMYGRYAISSEKDIYTYDFMDILTTYCDDFTKISSDTYICTVSDIATELKNFFQNRNYAYTNYFEIKIKDGKVYSFTPYEKSLTESYAYNTLQFSAFDKEEYIPYKNWKENGEIINLRIFDLKQGYSSLLTYTLLYNDEDIEIEGYVAGFDYSNNFYLTCQDSSTGNLGIRVDLSDKTNLPGLGDKVLINGTIKKDGYVAYLSQASYTLLEHNDSYPYFDEEAISKTYGGGYYAAYIFSQTPVYGDSIYSTYAYVASLPETVNEDKDTIIDLICPNQNDGSNTFSMQLILPKEMEYDEKEAAFNSLKEFSIYGESDAKEIYLEKFILRFNASYTYNIQLEFGKNSKITSSLSAAEKISEAFGVEVPLIESEEYVCFKFGASTGYLLEQYYGLDSSSTSGIYYFDDSITETDFNNEVSTLEENGFSIYDEIKDTYGNKHYLFTKDTLVIDILLYDNASYSSEAEYSIYMWIYEGDIIKSPSIQDILKSNISYFDSSDFIIDDLYDYYFTYYQLPNYAGNTFEEGNYLNCITMDTSKGNSYLLELTKKYIAEGYKVLRNSDNTYYSYITRGSSHYVLYKTIENSSEKVFIDLALYSTDDYTYLDHDEFTNRIEILIYKGTSPLETKYENNLDYFSNYIKENYDIDLTFNITSEIKVENYYHFANSSSFISYGYYFQYQIFIYVYSVNDTLTEIQQSLLNSGYSLSYTTSKGNYCYVNGSSYIFVMPNQELGYIRIIDGIGGVNF